MLEVIHLFKRLKAVSLITGMTLAGLVLPLVCQAEEAVQFKKTETGLYRDMFDQTVFYENTSGLRFDRLFRKLTRNKKRALNVNVYDEVPDSSFFTNRHFRQSMSAQELEQGYSENAGPDLSGNLSIIHGSSEGLHPVFSVNDSKGDEYKLKFDPIDNLELTTSAEIIASRFYYALGYNVPQYTLASFPADKLVPAEGATIYDDSGFKKKLTQERLEVILVFLPQDEEGRLRASVEKAFAGENYGFMSYTTRRKQDPADKVLHKDRREIRALQVFAAWLNNYDVREGNTADLFVNKNGNGELKHYLTDFNNAFGSSAEGPKPPTFGHEYIFDFGETSKAYLSLGLWQKPWQKRWKEVGEKVENSPAIGYFDNRYFDPAKYKVQLPYYGFKDVSRADGFWASKIMKSFSDDQIKSLVSAGKFSQAADAEYLANVLIERRDIIARYWFAKSNPLDQFDYANGSLTFKDLAVEYGFEPADQTVYHIDILSENGKKKITSFESKQTSIPVEQNWISQNSKIRLLIRTCRSGCSKPSAYVLVELASSGITGIVHED